MKSLRLLVAVSAVFAITSLRAADTDKSSAKASPAAKPSASPSATPDQSGLPDPVAVVDGKKIKRAELESQFTTELAAAGQPSDSLSAEETQKIYRDILDEMIIDRILRARSGDIKVTKDEVDKEVQGLKTRMGGSDDQFEDALKKSGLTLDKLKDNVRVSIQQRKWIDSQIGDKVSVTEEDAKNFYDKNPDDFQEPETIRVSHILIRIPKDATPDVVAQKEKAAEDAKARISKGEDFAKVAGEVSEDPDSKDKGGDLVDYFPRGSMSTTLPEFEDAAFKLKKGEVSDPVKTKLGWHIIKVTDIKSAQTLAYADEKTKIMEYLKQQKEKTAVNTLLKSLLDKSGAKILLPPLPKAPAQEDQSQQQPDDMIPAPASSAPDSNVPPSSTDQRPPVGPGSP